MRKQLTINPASQTSNRQIFALQKSAVTCHMSVVKCSSKGFTLMETLVAISILLVAVVGPISLIGDSLHKLYYARDEMLAINLAQEGIEVVRKVRDGNALDPTRSTWNDLQDTSSTRASYVIDISQINHTQAKDYLQKCNGNQCPTEQVVYIETATGRYLQGVSGIGYSPTQFKRFVEIENVGASSDEKKVTSIVTWKTGGETGTITESENIFKLTP